MVNLDDDFHEIDVQKLSLSQIHDAVHDSTTLHCSDNNGAVQSPHALHAEGKEDLSVAMLYMSADIGNLWSFSF